MTEQHEARQRSLDQRELDILYVCATCRKTLRSVGAVRHLHEGFYRRLLMMQASRVAMAKMSSTPRNGPLGPYENADLNMHLNSYYVQLRASLDNLAWCLHYEFSLLGEGDENSSDVQRRCHLWGQVFLKALHERELALAAQLIEKTSWLAELKKFRDPVAHRVPLYAVPIVISTEAELEQFKELSAEAASLAAAGDFRGAAEKEEDARRVGTYRPWFTTSGVDRIEPWSIPERTSLDQSNLFDISEGVLRALFPDPNMRVGF